MQWFARRNMHGMESLCNVVGSRHLAQYSARSKQHIFQRFCFDSVSFVAVCSAILEPLGHDFGSSRLADKTNQILKIEFKLF